MSLDDVLRNPVLKRALEAGEARVGKVVGRLLASDRITTGLQTLVSSALQAKDTFDRGMQQALHAANLPSKDDVASLKKKLAELETMIDGLSGRTAGPERAGPPDRAPAARSAREGGEGGAG